jgi:hypothetical protein
MNDWKQVNDNLKEWRKQGKRVPNLELYKEIIESVGLGKTIADIGCGQQHLKQLLPYGHNYIGIDPFPITENTLDIKAEDLHELNVNFDTTFMLAALDNVEDVNKTLENLKLRTKMNIVILTGINIPADKYHTHMITRKMLFDVLGKPLYEKEMLPNVYLFEWLV